MVAHIQNEPSFKNGWIPQSLSYIDIFLHCLPFKCFRIVLLPSTSRSMKEADIVPLALGDLLRYLGLWILMPACSGWKRDDFWNVTPFDQEENSCPYCLREFVYNDDLTSSLVNLGSLTLNTHPMLISFGKFARW